MRVIVTDTALKIDTSGCRSPSRAIRRLKKGIRGRVKLKPLALRLGDTLFVHPALKSALEQQADGWQARVEGRPW